MRNPIIRKPIVTTAVAAVLATGGFALAQDAGQTDRQNQQDQQRQQQQQDRQQQQQDRQQQGQNRQDQAQQRQNMQGQQAQMSPEQIKKAEQEFVNWSANTNLFEIEVAKLAQESSDDEQVKQLAQMLQSDHEQAQQLLTRAAEQAGYEVPSSIDKELVQKKLDMLKKNAQENPKEFNKAFVFGTVGGHAEAVLWNAGAAEMCQTQQLKQYAQTVLPKLQQHKRQAEQIAYNMVGGKTGSDMQREAQMAGAQLGGDANADDANLTDEQRREMRDRLNQQRRNNGEQQEQGNYGEQPRNEGSENPRFSDPNEREDQSGARTDREND